MPLPDPEVSKELGGAAAWFLGLCVAAITALGGGNVLQWKHSTKVYGYRLKERDDLRDALNDATKSREAATRAQEEQNRVIEELADAMRVLAAAFERHTDRLGLQFEHGKDKEREHANRLELNTRVVGELAEALRNNTAIVSDIRNKIDRQSPIA